MADYYAIVQKKRITLFDEVIEYRSNLQTIDKWEYSKVFRSEPELLAWLKRNKVGMEVELRFETKEEGYN